MKYTKDEIGKAATVISQRIVDEWYGGEEFPDDVELLREILYKLLVDNPKECQMLIGTAFCEEEEVEIDK
jgi:hypothetical protein